jgi:hypothetical protein
MGIRILRVGPSKRDMVTVRHSIARDRAAVADAGHSAPHWRAGAEKRWDRIRRQKTPVRIEPGEEKPISAQPRRFRRTNHVRD